jgi:hypothetical protein
MGAFIAMPSKAGRSQFAATSNMTQQENQSFPK